MKASGGGSAEGSGAAGPGRYGGVGSAGMVWEGEPEAALRGAGRRVIPEDPGPESDRVPTLK